MVRGMGLGWTITNLPHREIISSGSSHFFWAHESLDIRVYRIDALCCQFISYCDFLYRLYLIHRFIFETGYCDICDVTNCDYHEVKTDTGGLSKCDGNGRCDEGQRLCRPRTADGRASLDRKWLLKGRVSQSGMISWGYVGDG